MLDIKRLRDNVDEIVERLNTRGQDYSYLKDTVKYDEERRALVQKVEEFKNYRNEKSKEIGDLKRKGEDASAVLAEVDKYADDIKDLDERINELDAKIFKMLSETPNVPRETVAVGLDEDSNVCLREVGERTKFDFEPKPHYEVAEGLDIVDFERAAKITGSRFAIYKGLGAKLERALIAFMLDLHTQEHGYFEMIPPFLVNSKTMFGTGQLPKFEEDMFGVRNTDYWLIPTAEVPLTNYHAEEILNNPTFPMKFTAYTPCFRAEAGSAGRDTRGLIRQHQFNKVELVLYAHPDHSYEALDELTNNAEEVLKRLGLPYRVMQLCTGDTGFCSANTNDLEVWMPGFDTYREISSCSNCEDFQARRANIKFKEDGGKAEYVHTLNGSGVAIGRAFSAILENYQQADGSVLVPEVLVPYMGGITKIEKQK
ncbi:seryl-tRNA synthetase [Bacilli bacterium PM5-3]|nr:seryl-tRNA synthetase [Bacilli bacterium PM5-3]MDH6603313.1 seryl-tRNA synthetase [Bacilli bacterium PM5-9]